MHRGGLILLLLLLAGCKTSHALLLPGEDGHPVGALAVLNEDGTEQVMDSPLRSARMGGRRANLRTVTTVKPAYQQLLATLPPPPISFILNFYLGTTTITPESRPVLDQIRAEIARRSGAEVQVTGHTDTVGSNDDNDRLSMMRANEVMAWLITEGFPKDLLSAVGRGERELKVPTGDNVDNAENRRVEVIVR